MKPDLFLLPCSCWCEWSLSPTFVFLLVSQFTPYFLLLTLHLRTAVEAASIDCQQLENTAWRRIKSPQDFVGGGGGILAFPTASLCQV